MVVGRHHAVNDATGRARWRNVTARALQINAIGLSEAGEDFSHHVPKRGVRRCEDTPANVEINYHWSRTLKTGTFLDRDRFSAIPVLAAVALAVLSSSGSAFGGAIHDAASFGDLGKIKALLKDDPALISSRDQNGDTALHVAALFGHRDVVELLLANQADVNAKDNDGWTPLHCAADAHAFLGQPKDVAELLLAHKADVNAKSKGGFTPLHFAASEGHQDVAEVLLAHKADVNTKDDSGWTPLHYATGKSYEGLTGILRQSGAR
jgi:ankyrin repeat protein